MQHQQLTMDADRLRVMIDLLPQVDDLLPNLKSVEESWQPADVLPDFGGETWREDLAALRAQRDRAVEPRRVRPHAPLH